MPRARKRCGRRDCDEVMPCPKHTLPPWGNTRRRQELPGNWYSFIRPYVLARDPVCKLRYPECEIMSREVDHKGDKNDHRLHMLQGVCRACHALKTSAQGHAARADLH